MPSWRAFWRLSWNERRVLGQAVVILPLIGLLLRLLGFRGCRRFLARLGHVREIPRGTAAEVIRQDARLVARMVGAAGRHGLYRGNCLQQSLGLCWMLRRRGIPCELRIGIRKEANRVEAHAWVECQGVPLNEDQDTHRRFFAFGQAIELLRFEPS